MKTVLTVLLFVSPVVAQDQTAGSRASAGCGPSAVQFDVKTDKHKHPVGQLETGKALVYVFQDEKQDPYTDYYGAPTIRVGVDGQWVGANHGKSYFFFMVDPGEHRLCTDWQSRFRWASGLGAAVSFTAESGRTYYFRVQLEERKDRQSGVKVEQADSADGLLQIAWHALATSRPKEVASK